MTHRHRIASYDVMRIIAILLVLYNHLPGYRVGYLSPAGPLDGSLLACVLTRIGVPLFAMVSGALLLGRNETYGELWRRRISRMLMVVVVFEGLLYVEFHLTRPYPISLGDFLTGMLGGTLRGMTSYWFLYAYLGFLLMLPFLRRVAQALTRADFVWLVGLHVLLTTGPTLAAFVSRVVGCERPVVSPSLEVSLASVALYFYPLIGYWLDRHVDVARLTRRHWTLIGLATAAGMLVSAAMTWHRNAHSAAPTEAYLGLTVYVTAAAVFLAVKRCFDAGYALRHPRLNSVLCLVGSLVFGVYLLDQYLKLVLYEPLSHALRPALGAVGYSLVWCGVSLVVCGAATWALKHLPVFRKLL